MADASARAYIAGKPMSSGGVDAEADHSKEIIMKTDAQIRDDVETELRWDPSVDGTIGVIVQDGVVPRTGQHRHYARRWDAEAATKRVKGVRAIANEIQVKMPV